MRSLAVVALFLLWAVASVVGRPLRVSDDVEPPRSLNPLRVFEWKPDALLSHIYEGLLGFDPDGEVIPRLARKWEWAGPRVLRMTLVEGARFHDGSRFDASVAEANFKFIRSQGPECARCPLFATITHVEVLDPARIELRLSRPDGTLLHKLAAFSWMLPTAQLNVAGMEALEAHPVGAGPYRFAGWDEEGALRMEAFADYHGGPPALADGIRWFFLPDTEQVSRFTSGQLDLLGRVAPFFHASIQRLPGANIRKADTLIELGLVFNTARPKVASAATRKAISQAIRIEDLIQYVAQGNARPMNGSGMVGQIGRDPEGPLHDFAPREAHEYFRSHGPLELRGLLDPEFSLVGRALTAQLRKVGVDLHLETVDRDELFERVALPRLSGRGEWSDDLFVYSCPDPIYHYAFVNSLSPYGDGLWSTWRSAAYDSTFEEMVATRDPKEILALTRRLDSIVVQEVPKIELYQVRKGYAVREELDFRPTRNGMMDLRSSSWNRDQ